MDDDEAGCVELQGEGGALSAEAVTNRIYLYPKDLHRCIIPSNRSFTPTHSLSMTL